MAINYSDYIELPDTTINGSYVERYVFPDSTGMHTDSTAWYRTPEGYKVVDRTKAKLYKQDHPEGRPYEAQTYSEEERRKLFDDAFGKSKVEQKEDDGILSLAPKELVELVSAAMSNEDAANELSQLISQRPELEDIVKQIASALQGTPVMKCGGRVKKKEMGSKLTPKKVMASGGRCSCALKKVGGRLIEVDSCTGLPVHRNGGAIRKFQTAGKMAFKYNSDRWRKGYYYDTDGRNTWYGFNPADGKIYYAVTPTIESQNHFLDSYSTIPYSRLTLEQLNGMGIKKVTWNGGTYYLSPHSNNGVFTGYTDNGSVGRFGMGQDGKYLHDNGISDLSWGNSKWVLSSDALKRAFNPLSQLSFLRNSDGSYYMKLNGRIYSNNNRVNIDGFNYDYNINDVDWTPALRQQLMEHGFTKLNGYNDYIDQLTADAAASRTNAGYGGLFTGDLSAYRNLNTRKKWVADNADYLRAQGWTDDLIAGYHGSAADNQLLAKQIGGMQSWRDNQPKYTNSALMGMTDEQAASLTESDAARRAKLNQYMLDRNNALTINGQTYANEDDYNIAAAAYNKALFDKHDAEANALLKGRQAAQTAKTKGQTARRLKAFGNLVKQYEGTLDMGTLSKRDLNDMYRLMARDQKAGYYGAGDAKSFYSYTDPVFTGQAVSQTYNGPAALTERLLNAYEFRNGGRLNYVNYF